MILRPLTFLHSSAKNYARTALSCICFEIFNFELLDPELLTDNTHNMFHFDLLDPELLANNTQNIFGETWTRRPFMYLWDTNSVKLLVCTFIEGYTEGSQDRTHGKQQRIRALMCHRRVQNHKIGSNPLPSILTVSSTYVYVHKCVAEECRISRRSGRTHCTQYLKDVGSNSLHSRYQDPAAPNKIFRICAR